VVASEQKVGPGSNAAGLFPQEARNPKSPPRLSHRITLEVHMAWIKRKIDASSGATNTTDFYAGGAVLIATMATIAALYSIGM
jgi:hypothetical protein